MHPHPPSLLKQKRMTCTSRCRCADLSRPITMPLGGRGEGGGGRVLSGGLLAGCASPCALSQDAMQRRGSTVMVPVDGGSIAVRHDWQRAQACWQDDARVLINRTPRHATSTRLGTAAAMRFTRCSNGSFVGSVAAVASRRVLVACGLATHVPRGNTPPPQPTTTLIHT